MTILVERRRDGWPLCPQCGDDELHTTINPFFTVVEDGRPMTYARLPRADDPMACYACGWSGFVFAIDVDLLR